MPLFDNNKRILTPRGEVLLLQELRNGGLFNWDSQSLPGGRVRIHGAAHDGRWIDVTGETIEDAAGKALSEYNKKG